MADIFTKSLGRILFQQFRDALGVKLQPGKLIVKDVDDDDDDLPKEGGKGCQKPNANKKTYKQHLDELEKLTSVVMEGEKGDKEEKVNGRSINGGAPGNQDKGQRREKKRKRGKGGNENGNTCDEAVEEEGKEEAKKDNEMMEEEGAEKKTAKT